MPARTRRTHRVENAVMAVVWLAAWAGIGVWMAWRIGAVG